MSKRDFDVVRGCFYLVAFVIGAQVFAVLIAEITCLYQFKLLLATSRTCGEPGALGELITGALAAALAFAGSRVAPTEPLRKPEYDENDPDGV